MFCLFHLNGGDGDISTKRAWLFHDPLDRIASASGDRGSCMEVKISVSGATGADARPSYHLHKNGERGEICRYQHSVTIRCHLMGPHYDRSKYVTGALRARSPPLLILLWGSEVILEGVIEAVNASRACLWLQATSE